MFNDYTLGLLENSNKFTVLFKLIEETIMVGERLLLFSQSLLTLDLIETFLQERSVPSKNFRMIYTSFEKTKILASINTKYF